MNTTDNFESILHAIFDGEHAFKVEHGRKPAKMYCSPEAFHKIMTSCPDLKDSDELPRSPKTVYRFQASPMDVFMDKSLNNLEMKFAG